MIFIAFLGGLLTILSPCILPILPFLLAQSQGANGAKRSGLFPFLLGLVLMFTVVASLSTLSSHWIIQANTFGRIVALGLLALFALTLLSPRINHWVMSPFTTLGNRLTHFTGRIGTTGPIVLGMATGLLWAPCAGPILGLILSSAMLQGNSVNTTALLLAYGLGAMLYLLTLVLLSQRIFARLVQGVHKFTERLRIVAGYVTLVAVVAISRANSNLS